MNVNYQSVCWNDGRKAMCQWQIPVTAGAQPLLLLRLLCFNVEWEVLVAKLPDSLCLWDYGINDTIHNWEDYAGSWEAFQHIISKQWNHSQEVTAHKAAGVGCWKVTLHWVIDKCNGIINYAFALCRLFICTLSCWFIVFYFLNNNKVLHLMYA